MPQFTSTQLFSAVAVAAAVALSHAGWMTTDQFFGVCAVAGLHVSSAAVVSHGSAQVQAAAHALATAQVQVPDAKDGVQNAVVAS